MNWLRENPVVIILIPVWARIQSVWNVNTNTFLANWLSDIWFILLYCSWGWVQLYHGLYKSHSRWFYTANNCNQHYGSSWQCRERSFAAISVALSKTSLPGVWLFGKSWPNLLQKSRWVNSGINVVNVCCLFVTLHILYFTKAYVPDGGPLIELFSLFRYGPRKHVNKEKNENNVATSGPNNLARLIRFPFLT